MKLYTELASWWPMLSPPQDYEKEAEFYHNTIEKYGKGVKPFWKWEVEVVKAFFLKKHYQLTLSDLSPKMLEISKKLKPECEHIVGDMRMLQLKKVFDAVFIHDAIACITSEDNLKRIFLTAANHLNTDGFLFITPDYFKETLNREPNMEAMITLHEVCVI